MTIKQYFFRTFLILSLGGVFSSGTVSCGKSNSGGGVTVPPNQKPWPSPKGDVVGKITVGYQGWFACKGDGSPIDAWWHWSTDWAQAPTINLRGFSSWPDVRDYTNTYVSGFPDLNNGTPAKLFSSYSDQTVDMQFSWMEQFGLDVVALQRFSPYGIEGPIRDTMALKVKKASEKHGRKFYIMYDVSGWTNMQSQIKDDWTNKMKTYTSSSAYAKQNGKPVVCIWGFGFSDPNHPWDAATCKDVVDWFKGQGCYVIGGVPTHWRDQNSDSRSGFIGVYKDFDMLSPWMVGRISKMIDVENFYANEQTLDLKYCKDNGIDYQPCVLPGDLSQHQRIHGDLMWRQFYNMTRLGVQGIYISMFDEFNEGNQIVKTAEDQSMVPSGAGFVTLDEDGTACSADYYMRLTNDGGKMFKGETALTAVRPTAVK